MVENYRNLSSIDVSIPESAQFICLVGPNGSSKSALMSFVIDSLYSLASQTMDESLGEQGFVDGLSKQSYRKKISRVETGPLGKAHGCRLNWRTKRRSGLSYFQYVYAGSRSDDFAVEVDSRLTFLTANPDHTVTVK